MSFLGQDAMHVSWSPPWSWDCWGEVRRRSEREDRADAEEGAQGERFEADLVQECLSYGVVFMRLFLSLLSLYVCVALSVAVVTAQLSAFYCEGIMSCGGQIVLPPGYLKQVYKYAQQWPCHCLYFFVFFLVYLFFHKFIFSKLSSSIVIFRQFSFGHHSMIFHFGFCW